LEALGAVLSGRRPFDSEHGESASLPALLLRCTSHKRQLALSPIEQTHHPSSRFAAVLLEGIVRARATASSCEVAFAISLGMATRARTLGVAIGHNRSGYLICGSDASMSSTPTIQRGLMAPGRHI
jgi:hypothetical protein